MDWLKRIFRKEDPYETSAWSVFFEEGIFETETAFGYKLRYKMACNFKKVDHQPFKRARMLEDQSRKEFLAITNKEVVLSAFRSKDRFIRFTFARPSFPALCLTVEEGDNKYIACDVACVELNKELKTSRFTHSGCEVISIDVRFLPYSKADPETIEQNYNRMIKLHDISSVVNTPLYATVEEAQMVAFAHRELELRRFFTDHQTNQIHEAHHFSVTTRTVGRGVEIKWRFKLPLPERATMRGFKKEGGFWTGTFPLENNGVCIADSKSDSSTILSLAAGTEHFFTFVIQRDEPGKQVIFESLRLSVRVPTQEELSQIDGLIKATEKRSETKPELGKKTSEALQELLSFVEFDENVSQLEKQLIERISNKDYSPEEKARKIDRLQALVESLHIQ